MGRHVIFRFWNKFVRAAVASMIVMAVWAPAQAEVAYSKTHIFEDDIKLGAETAPITVILYASPTCPHCKGFFRGYYSRLKAEYVDSGHLRIIFREIATQPAGYARFGSILARCASEKSGAAGYVKTFDRFFPDGRSDVPELTSDAILDMAENAGIDRETASACLGRTDIQIAFERNQKHAFNVLKLSSTPGFVIDGEVLSLNSDYSQIFRAEHRIFQVLDEVLARHGIDTAGVNARKLARKSIYDLAERMNLVLLGSAWALEDQILWKLNQVSKERILIGWERKFLTDWEAGYDPEWPGFPHYLDQEGTTVLINAREAVMKKIE
jgi:protein-disulfide isomerase